MRWCVAVCCRVAVFQCFRCVAVSCSYICVCVMRAIGIHMSHTRNCPHRGRLSSSRGPHTAKHCNTLQHTYMWSQQQWYVQHYNTRKHTAPPILKRQFVTQFAATHCNKLQQTAAHTHVVAAAVVGDTMQHREAHCNTRKHTQMTHCNTQKHTATHESTLR